MRLKAFVVFAVLGVCASALGRTTECTMKYNLKGWSAFYKTAAGVGTIRCDNGQRADVRLSSRGGGLTAGRTEIRNGVGYFSRVSNISELFGPYTAASAGAAAGKAASAQALIKDNIHLSLTGQGKGYELGVALGRLTISRK
jgi:hypothetical protein